MATLAMFRAQFPELNGSSDILVAQMLGAASLFLDTSVWGPFGVDGGLMTKADQGQLYLAAHKLAISPFGQNAKLNVNMRLKGYSRTTYGAEFEILMYSVTGGFRVA